MQDKTPFNSQGQAHGYHEVYHPNDRRFKGHFINGIPYGYCEYCLAIPNEYIYYAR